jgi:hypothetical protein
MSAFAGLVFAGCGSDATSGDGERAGKLGCEVLVGGHGDYGEGIAANGPPVAIARHFFERHGLRSGDVVSQRAKVAGSSVRVALIRDSETVALVTVERIDGDRWRLSTVEACDGVIEPSGM